MILKVAEADDQQLCALNDVAATGNTSGFTEKLQRATLMPMWEVNQINGCSWWWYLATGKNDLKYVIRGNPRDESTCIIIAICVKSIHFPVHSVCPNTHTYLLLEF